MFILHQYFHRPHPLQSQSCAPETHPTSCQLLTQLWSEDCNDSGSGNILFRLVSIYQLMHHCPNTHSILGGKAELMFKNVVLPISVSFKLSLWNDHCWGSLLFLIRDTVKMCDEAGLSLWKEAILRTYFIWKPHKNHSKETMQQELHHPRTSVEMEGVAIM